MSVKLRFKTDFTDFLMNDEFSGSIKLVTQSEIIECSAVLLAQHSSVLREMIKEDNEVFLTDNNHVRECLTVLYGGEIKLTEENFHDILKFMVLFHVEDAKWNVLHWMKTKTWNLDNANLLINSSIAVVKVLEEVPNSIVDRFSQMSILAPSRLFFEIRLKTIVNSNSTDTRNRSIDSAMEYLIQRVVDQRQFLKLLLDEALIAEYVPWIISLIDQSNYKIVVESLGTSQISNKMALLTRSQSEELFGKIEDLENLTMKDFKQLNKCKLDINEKITILKSLRFIKEDGNLFSCWKMLDGDGMTVLTNAFTDILDQFCIIECLLSWYSDNHYQSLCETRKHDVTESLLTTSIQRIYSSANDVILDDYISNVYKYCSQAGLAIPKLPKSPRMNLHSFFVFNTTVSVEGVDILLQITGQLRSNWFAILQEDRSKGIKFIVRISNGNLPEISVDRERGKHKISLHQSRENEYGKIVEYDGKKFNVFVYASIADIDKKQSNDGNDSKEKGNDASETQKYISSEHIPLYCDPRAAYKMINERLLKDGDVVTIKDVTFHMLFISRDLQFFRINLFD
ncbi:hypothetical protein ACHWQZ_G015244 [Mnemiopsis leidyi]